MAWPASGCHQRRVRPSGRQNRLRRCRGASPDLRMGQRGTGEFKAAIVGTYRAIKKKHVPRYLADSNIAGLIDPSKVIVGGKSDRDAHYLDPTILFPATWDDKVMEDEIFGPILPILTYKSLDEAFARIAATPRPLAAFIFSRDQTTIDRFIGELSYGGGAVNLVNVHLFVETMPFGGIGSAGMGHYYGKYGFDVLTHAKSMLISPPDVAIDHLFPPYTPEKNAALKQWFEY